MVAFRYRISGSATVIVLLFGVTAAGDNGDDFSNNLFSDLSPLLALFGEQFTKQYLSQSITWLESIIFACAPLGIITAIVGAIRVGGPSWMKAVIGRARETAAAAELDLMSSTSHEVCELWNGESIVRVMGSAPVQEFIFFEPTADSEKDTLIETAGDAQAERLLRVSTLEEVGIKFPLLKRKEHAGLWFPPSWRGWPQENYDEERGRTYTWPYDHTASGGNSSSSRELDTTTKDAPNISLNVKPSKSAGELYLMALLGIVAQTAVLVFGGLVTYRWELLKGGVEVKPYSYPAIAAGTVVLAIGMFICAAIVERSTKEVNYVKVPGGKRYNIRMVWLQRGRIVNDQTFESFAVIAKTPSDAVLTSRRRISRGRPGAPRRQRSGMHKRLIWIASSPSEAATVAGVLVSLVGFILQFSGLRGSHWTISISQLAATLTMTVVRAIGRRSLVRRPFSESLTPGYEQDWLATGIGRDREKFWEYYTDTGDGYDNVSSLHEATGQAKGPSTTTYPWRWGILTGDNARALWIKHPGAVADDTSKSQNVIRIRQRLGTLSKWTGPVSQIAVSVASSIDEVMNILFPSDAEPFVFALKVQYGDENHMVQLTVEKRSPEKPWATNAAEIEAILSLWVYHMQKAERADANNRHISTRQMADDGRNMEEEDWLRKGDTALPQHNLRFLGPDTVCLRRDLNWWMPNRLSTLLRVEEITPADRLVKSAGQFPSIVGYNHITGFSKLSDSEDAVAREPMAMRVVSKNLNIDEIEADSSRPTLALASMSNTPPEVCFAQHIFSAFMWAVSKKITRIKGQSSAKQMDMLANPTAWHHFKLENTTISRIAQAVQKTGLGNLEDVYLCIIPPLSLALRLPDAAAAGLVLNAITGREQYGTLGEFVSTYLELLRFGTEFGPSADGRLCSFAIKSVAIVLEYYRTVSFTAQLLKSQLRDANALESIRDELAAKLKAVDPKLMHVLRTMYENQDRLEGLDGLVPELPTDYNRSSEDIDIYMEYTPLNREIFARRFKEAEPYLKYTNERDILGWSPLFYVVNMPDLDDGEFVNLLSEFSANPRAQDIFGYTPLHYACLKGKSKQALKLILKKPDLSMRGRDEMTVLHCAALGGVRAVVRNLLEQRGVTVDARDRYMRTPLHLAAWAGNYSVAELLLQYNASPLALDDHDRTPFHLAALCEDQWLRLETVKALLKASGDAALKIKGAKDKDGKTAVILAVSKQHTDVMSLLSEDDRDARIALRTAAGAGMTESVRVFLDKGVTIDDRDADDGRTVLHCAAAGGHTAIVEMILEKLRGPAFDLASALSYVNGTDGMQWTPLLHAVDGGYEPIVRILLENGADPLVNDSRGQAAIVLAARKGYAGIVGLLHRGGINTVTAFFRAVELGDEPTAMVLIDHVDLEAEDTHYMSAKPIQIAARFGKDNMVRLLLERGANIGEPGKEITALHWACERGHIDVVRTLIEAGANVEIEDSGGIRPLHNAASAGHADIVRLLIDIGAEKEPLDKRGRTPLEVCRTAGSETQTRMGKEAVEDLLLEVTSGGGGGGGSDSNPQPENLLSENSGLVFDLQL